MDTRAASGLISGIILTVIGAILYYAVTATVEGVDLDAVGAILMVAGIVLAAFGLISAFTAGIKGRTTTIHRYQRDNPSETIVEREQ